MNRRQAIGTIIAAAIAPTLMQPKRWVTGVALYDSLSSNHCPRIGDRFPGRSDVVVTRVEMKRTRCPWVWTAFVHYEGPA